MKILTAIILMFTISFCQAQSIEKFSIDNGGASVSTGGIQLLYTIGEVNVQEIDAGTVSVSEGFITSGFKIRVNPKVFLQGPLINPATANLMNDDLRQNALIPTISPYEDGATCSASVFDTSGNDAIVDWVWLELRALNDNTTIVKSRSALVQRDGDVVDMDGTSHIEMQAPPNNYYIVIKHRNHLGVMSSNTFGLREEATTTIDFTDNTFLTYGSNAQVQLSSGNTALWSGDLNNDTKIQFSGAGNDVNTLKDFIIANAPLPLLTIPVSGYFNEDLDLNGQAKFSGSDNDSNLVKDIIIGHPLNILGLPTFTITSQVPNN